MAENAAALDTQSSKDLWKLLEKTSAKKPDKIEVAQNLADGLYKGIMDVAQMQNPETKREQQKNKKASIHGIISISSPFLILKVRYW